MLVTIMQKPTEIAVNTVSLVNDGKPDLHLFRCVRCGSSIAQYKGTIASIVPVYEPTSDASVIHRCKDCKEMYTFQTHKGKSGETKVVLKHDPIVQDVPRQSTEFICPICRRPVIEYSLTQFFDLANQTMVTLPVRIKCSYPTCTAHYLFTEVV